MNSSSLRLEIDSNFVWQLFLALCVITSILMTSDIAFAAEPVNKDDVIGITLCRLVKNLSGGIARGIATLAIFSVGVGMFLGKLNWGVAGATAAGVGVIFSAPKLVAFLSGDSDTATCDVIS
jgi:type IV secretory pathway VirB2 component (pilin)